MGDMNFPDPGLTTEHDGWLWDGDKWTRTASSNSFDPTVEKVATGTLANGDAVVLNDDGTVSVVAEIATSVEVGKKNSFAQNATYPALSYDPVANKVLIAYSDVGNSSYGTAVLGTVSGEDITFGTPVVFESSNAQHIALVYHPVEKSHFLAYRDVTLSGKGRVVIISGDTLSVENPNTWHNTRVRGMSLAYDSNAGKISLAYTRELESYNLHARVVTLSGNAANYGTDLKINNSSSRELTFTTYDPVTNQVVIAQNGGSPRNSYVYVGSISGTTITVSSGQPLASGETYDEYTPLCYDPAANKVVFAYRGADNFAYARVGTLSSGAVTLGDPVPVPVDVISRVYGLSYDYKNNKIAFIFSASGSYYVVSGSVSGDTITFETPEEFDTKFGYLSTTYDESAEKALFAYKVNGGSNNGVIRTLATGSVTTNLTADNFEGFSSGTYSDGETAKVLVNGSIAVQSGLTTAKYHYVQGDGTVDTDSGGVFAGTALSSNELIVEGSNNG